MSRTNEDIRNEIAEELQKAEDSMRQATGYSSAAYSLSELLPDPDYAVEIQDRIIELEDQAEMVADEVETLREKVEALDFTPPEPVQLVTLSEGDKFRLNGEENVRSSHWTVRHGFHCDHDPTEYEAECESFSRYTRTFGGSTLVHRV